MKITSHSVKDTLNIGKKIVRLLKKGDIICLFGQLGAGKTVLVKGLAMGLGMKKEEIVSPTFVLLNRYEKGRLPLYHFDLYRLESKKDILALGYEEYFYGDGVSVIEWADRLGNLLPKEYLKVNLNIKNAHARQLIFSARGKNYTDLLRKINEALRD